MRLRTAFLLLAAVVIAGIAAPAAAQSTGGATWSASDCETCHSTTIGPAFQRTKHAGLTQSCATCHDGVADHVKAQLAGDSGGPVPSLKKKSASELNAKCLG